MIKSKYGNRPTLGQHHKAQMQKTDVSFDDMESMERAMSDPAKLEETIWNTVDLYKKAHPHKDGYIHLNIIKDRAVANYVKMLWVARTSCPDPFYNETVWKYEHADDSVSLLWSLPDPQACKDLLKYQGNAQGYEKVVVDFVVNYKNGTLLELANKENGITDKTVFLLDKTKLKATKKEEMIQ